MNRKISCMLSLALASLMLLAACDSEALNETTSDEIEIITEAPVTENAGASEEITTETTTAKAEAEAEAETEAKVSYIGTVVGYTTKGYAISEKDGITYVNNVLVANKTYSLPESYNPGDLLNDCEEAFNKMKSAAEEEGLSLWNASGFRSYELQQSLYNRYSDRDGKEAADRYSARPGHSEHQSGLAIDLNEISSSFKDTAEGKWVAENCHKYGFILRYPQGKEAQTGYMYEPWHIRYVGVDTATNIYNSGLCLEEYFGITSAYAVEATEKATQESSTEEATAASEETTAEAIATEEITPAEETTAETIAG